jgi:hypothetical protein
MAFVVDALHYSCLSFSGITLDGFALGRASPHANPLHVESNFVAWPELTPRSLATLLLPGSLSGS